MYWLTFLVTAGKITPAALDRVQRLHTETGDPLDLILARLGVVAEADISRTLAETLNISMVQAADLPSKPLLFNQLRPGFLRTARAFPLADTSNGIALATANPADDATAAAVAYAIQRLILLRVAPAPEIERWFGRLYGAATQPGPQPVPVVDASDDLDRLRDFASDAPVIRLVNRWLNQAVEAGASDIHIEPQEDALRMRPRIDGVLAETDTQPAHLHAVVVSRLKIMARLDIGEQPLTHRPREMLWQALP